MKLWSYLVNDKLVYCLADTKSSAIHTFSKTYENVDEVKVTEVVFDESGVYVAN